MGIWGNSLRRNGIKRKPPPSSKEDSHIFSKVLGFIEQGLKIVENNWIIEKGIL